MPGSTVAAQGQGQQSAAQRCFEHHKFGAQPVDVAKSADGQTVLAQVSWGYHEAIGCFLTLDDAALAALRAAPAPQSLPDAETEASRRCFQPHQFGERPVDVAKSADRQTVLARLSWSHHNTIGCYLTLDDTALVTLRDAADTDAAEIEPLSAGAQFAPIAAGSGHSCAIGADQTITCWGDNGDGRADAPAGQFAAIAAGYAHTCAIKTDQTITCWGSNSSGQISVPTVLRTPREGLLSVTVSSESEPVIRSRRSFDVAVGFSREVSGFDVDDMNVVNGVVTRLSGSGHKYEATVTAAALGTVVVLVPRAAAIDQDGRGNEPSQPFIRTVRATARGPGSLLMRTSASQPFIRTVRATASTAVPVTPDEVVFDTWDREAVPTSPLRPLRSTTIPAQ